MTPTEKMSVVWYWLPVRWTNGSAWFEVAGVAATETGVDLQIKKDDAEPVVVSFTDAELGGEVGPSGARARVEAI